MREEIQRKFNEIADQASIPEIAVLIREVGELMQARFNSTMDAYEGLSGQITGLHGDLSTLRSEFVDLSTLLTTRLKATERINGDRIKNVIDRTHDLGNRFVAVENKVDETMEVLQRGIAELMQAVANGVGNDGSTTTEQ